MSYYGSVYPPGVSTSDLPGWQRIETPAPCDPIEYFPAVEINFEPTEQNLAWQAKLAAALERTR